MATPQKRMFQMSNCAQRKPPEQPQKIPRAADIKVGTPGVASFSTPPPKTLLDRLGNPAVVVGFDIEACQVTSNLIYSSAPLPESKPHARDLTKDYL